MGDARVSQIYLRVIQDWFKINSSVNFVIRSIYVISLLFGVLTMAGTTNNTPWTMLVVGATQYKANFEARGASFGMYYPFLTKLYYLQ